MENVFLMNHPLIQHKISMLRDKKTGTNEFRKLVEEIAVLMGYEALRDLPVEPVEVETPLETCQTPMISGKTGRCADTACRAWHGKRYTDAGAKRQGRSYRAVPQS